MGGGGGEGGRGWVEVESRKFSKFVASLCFTGKYLYNFIRPIIPKPQNPARDL